MSLISAVAYAVRVSLNANGKAYDLNQVMSADPFTYNTAGKVRVFLRDVATHLAQDVPSWRLDVSTVDLVGAMADTVVQLQARIKSAITGSL